MVKAIDTTKNSMYRHTYPHGPVSTNAQLFDMELNAGKLVAEYYGHRMNTLAGKLKSTILNLPLSMMTNGFVENDSAWYAHSPIMDYPTLAVIEEAIAADDRRPIVIYAGNAHIFYY